MAAGDSVVSICNIGLIAIGADPITALTDDVKAAILCNQRYDQIRREVLALHTWNFARRKAQLALAAVQPPFGLAAYSKPADYIRMDHVWQQPHAVWEDEDGTIASDGGTPLNIVYIGDAQDPTRYDPLFVATLGYSVGMELAQPITQDRGKEDEMRQKRQEKLDAARLVASQNNSSRELDTDVLLWARDRG